MTKLVSTTDLWQAIRQLSSAATRTRAAVAYFTDPGDFVLRRGDLLIVDASEESIRNGRTSAPALESAFRAGVDVYSLANLHAKVMVFDRTVVCGSANLSNSARNTLQEAGIVSELPALHQDALQVIEGFRRQATLVDEPFIERAAKIPVTRSGGATTDRGLRNPTLLEALDQDNRILRDYVYAWIGGKADVDEDEVKKAVNRERLLPKGLDRKRWTWSQLVGSKKIGKRLERTLQNRPCIWFKAEYKNGMITRFTDVRPKPTLHQTSTVLRTPKGPVRVIVDLDQDVTPGLNLRSSAPRRKLAQILSRGLDNLPRLKRSLSSDRVGMISLKDLRDMYRRGVESVS